MSPDLFEIEIIEKTDGIHLSDLGLSARLYNCLKRGGYNTLADIMLESPEQFSKIRNFGRSSEHELFALRTFIQNADRSQIVSYCEEKGTSRLFLINTEIYSLKSTTLEVALNKKVEGCEMLFVNSTGEYCDDIDIVDLNLSARTINSLMQNQINSLRELVRYPYQDLSKLKGIRQKSMSELLAILEDKVLLFEAPEVNNYNVGEAVESVIEYFEPLLGQNSLSDKKRELTLAIIQVCGKQGDVNSINDELLVALAKVVPVDRLIRQLILSSVSDKIFLGVDKRTLVEEISRQSDSYNEILNNTIAEMISDNQIRVIKGKVYKYKVFMREWLDTLEGNSKVALECRCLGMTLEEIGTKLGLTRERVRQIVSKTLKRAPKLYEDDYIEFVEKYYFSKDEFCQLFDLKIEQVNYLLLSYKRGALDVQAFLNDDTVPGYIKERIPRVFKGKVLVLDGECIPLKRDVLLHRLLKFFYSDKECSVEEFADFYEGFLRENQIDEYEYLLFPNRRALEARISDYPYTIARFGHKIRYYDTESVDINALLESIDIGRYEDTEISTLKLVRDWPEVMEQYDIRDEYELHNLIRKKIDEVENYNISVMRMPFITIGDGERIKQVEDLLLQMAPVTNTDLAAEYDQRYGVRTETVLANFFKCIDVFYHDGIFDLEQQDLPNEDYEALHAVLTGDIYLWDNIVKTYHKVSKKPKLDAINAMTLKKLGFRVYSQYVINAKYPSADAFFTELLLRDEVLDLTCLPQGVRTIQTCYSVLTGLRDSLDLIEVQRDIYYRHDYFTKKYGVNDKETLAELGKEALLRIADTEYFSIDVIASGDELADSPRLIRNPYVLNSLVRVQPEFKTSRIANIYIGTKRGNELSQLGLITYIVGLNGEMSTKALIKELKSKYSLDLERSRILYVIEDSNEVAYDDIFDYICLNTKWKGYGASVYLSDTRFSGIIEPCKEQIMASDALIVKVYWIDKYTEFVDYCGMNECLKMRDILSLDFRKLHDNASKLNLSRGAISDVIDIFIEWVKGLGAEEIADDDENILDLFFK